MSLYDVEKRIIDIIGSLVGIVLFSPFLFLGVVWIKCVSPNGPILADIPDRVGKNKKPFKFFKLRSMIPEAHEYLLKHPDLHKKYLENNYKIDAHEDPRLLPGARFIRKFSIDEMPQVFNVLRGDMSLVGPRAYYFFEIDEQREKHPEVDEYINCALTVKPGLTGVWQVNGRSEIAFCERVKMDAIYAKKNSILYDLLIILKTPLAVLSAKGAY
jgi:exopolysaccharide production protein ExoY